ncbi:hypothetical protein hrd7_21510 [Leptolinea sp. HRD-7]|nr:hypothetical protein hrd7_21510 [Leptolinea sp. HRD-7]
MINKVPIDPVAQLINCPNDKTIKAIAPDLNSSPYIIPSNFDELRIITINGITPR